MTLVSSEPVARQALIRRAGAAGSTGAVAAASPVAAAAGAAALLEGGNCVDAALSACFVETVVLAPKCGLAGDVVALHLAPGAAEPEALLAIGPAAAGLAASVRARGNLPATGGISVGVPGAPAGYSALAARARFRLSRLCAPAIAIARRGFSWSGVCATLASEADTLLTQLQPGGSRFRPASGPLKVGTLVRLPGLAAVLEAFARDSSRLFAGPLGEAVVAAAAADGGVLTLDDLARPVAEWTPAPRIDISGTTIWSTPRPTFGPALLAVVAQARQRLPASMPGIVASVLADQAARASDGSAHEVEGTSVVAATDADGGAVIVVHSNSFPQFGSGLVLAEHDLVLSNRAGRGFSPDPNRPNFPNAARRPLTTLHAWAMRNPDQVFLGGTPGGAQQVPWNAQVLDRLLNGDEPGEAICTPLWRLDHHRTVAEADADEPADETIPPLTMHSSQVVVAPPVHGGVPTAWADPRSDALALGL